MPTLTASSEDVRIYELAVLYPFPFGQKDETALLKEMEELFTEAGGKLVSKDPWGRRGLAYAIKGAMEANFIVYYWEIDPLKIKEIDQALRIMKNVLRHLFVKPPKHYQVIKFSESYQKWLSERESVEETRSREREEKLQDQVAKKAKRQAQRTTDRKKDEVKSSPIQEDVLTEKLDKLIADDGLDI